ncbi:Retrovirus-related Pol polyprotein from transposon 412 [Araneus ventricosus]|uniref:Retrovirus-related Pol polyprotein from transposon 412 n=1 Tax=Araneus ventricosus TaxID=182803 RepID=A0A4Y2D2D7_ARAVE|nr:Retrovirus-related Pol polyprotein from transposon 412 [Araneus ventricosus]
MLQGLPHPGVKATTNLINQSFVCKSVNNGIMVQEWCKFCIACQKSKIHRHTKSPLGLFKLPNSRFNRVHIEVVGPLLSSKGYTFASTCIDRFSRWFEAFPMCNQLAETVAQTLYAGWISRFGVPEIISSDRGSDFESNIFQALTKFLGASKTRTTSFHPIANGIVEMMHRQLKAAIKCYASSS